MLHKFGVPKTLDAGFSIQTDVIQSNEEDVLFNLDKSYSFFSQDRLVKTKCDESFKYFDELYKKLQSDSTYRITSEDMILLQKALVYISCLTKNKNTSAISSMIPIVMLTRTIDCYKKYDECYRRFILVENNDLNSPKNFKALVVTGIVPVSLPNNINTFDLSIMAKERLAEMFRKRFELSDDKPIYFKIIVTKALDSTKCFLKSNVQNADDDDVVGCIYFNKFKSWSREDKNVNVQGQLNRSKIRKTERGGVNVGRSRMNDYAQCDELDDDDGIVCKKNDDEEDVDIDCIIIYGYLKWLVRKR